ncbi:hypothetical protein BDQ12DRAFT_45202 [Crucibulum laeve]|uniref:Uncharacterized protein n=1 Tax=Crucibulum laeve TaxID=68775 RepID=A0A5C3MHZ5_9AGAR|nr:hypothetical protein BDQ12DRAFT_45202 [Crucibulum laeve]
MTDRRLYFAVSLMRPKSYILLRSSMNITDDSSLKAETSFLTANDTSVQDTSSLECEHSPSGSDSCSSGYFRPSSDASAMKSDNGISSLRGSPDQQQEQELTAEAVSEDLSSPLVQLTLSSDTRSLSPRLVLLPPSPPSSTVGLHDERGGSTSSTWVSDAPVGYSRASIYGPPRNDVYGSNETYTPHVTNHESFSSPVMYSRASIYAPPKSDVHEFDEPFIPDITTNNKLLVSEHEERTSSRMRQNSVGVTIEPPSGPGSPIIDADGPLEPHFLSPKNASIPLPSSDAQLEPEGQKDNTSTQAHSSPVDPNILPLGFQSVATTNTRTDCSLTLPPSPGSTSTSEPLRSVDYIYAPHWASTPDAALTYNSPRSQHLDDLHFVGPAHSTSVAILPDDKLPPGFVPLASPIPVSNLLPSDDLEHNSSSNAGRTPYYFPAQMYDRAAPESSTSSSSASSDKNIKARHDLARINASYNASSLIGSRSGSAESQTSLRLSSRPVLSPEKSTLLPELYPIHASASSQASSHSNRSIRVNQNTLDDLYPTSAYSVHSSSASEAVSPRSSSQRDFSERSRAFEPTRSPVQHQDASEIEDWSQPSPWWKPGALPSALLLIKQQMQQMPLEFRAQSLSLPARPWIGVLATQPLKLHTPLSVPTCARLMSPGLTLLVR